MRRTNRAVLGGRGHALAFADLPPDPADLSPRSHALLAAAREIRDIQLPAEVDRCVLDSEGGL